MNIKQIKEKVWGFIKNIPADKKKHLIAGFIVCAIVSMFFGYIIGFILALVAAAGSLRLLYEERNAGACRFHLLGGRRGLFPYCVGIDYIAFLRFCHAFYLGFSRSII